MTSNEKLALKKTTYDVLKFIGAGALFLGSITVGELAAKRTGYPPELGGALVLAILAGILMIEIIQTKFRWTLADLDREDRYRALEEQREIDRIKREEEWKEIKRV